MMNKKLRQSATLLTITTLTLCTLSGCLISSHSAEKETGTRITATTIKQIETGITTKDWVLSALGPPTSKSTFTPADPTQTGEIWLYEYQKTRASTGTLLFLLSTSSRKTSTETHHLEFIDNIVNRLWTD